MTSKLRVWIFLFVQTCLEELDEQLCPKAAGVSEQLESMYEGDASVMKVFVCLEDMFESYFKTVDETTKNQLAMEKWKMAWLQSECESLARNYSDIQRLMTEVDIQMKDLDVTDQKM